MVKDAHVMKELEGIINSLTNKEGKPIHDICDELGLSTVLRH